MKTAYFLLITPNKGNNFTQHLTLSEAKLFPQIIRENKCVLISLVELTENQYKLIFNN